MPERAQWVKLENVSSGFEADLARQSLEEAGIPVMVSGKQVGIWGAGYQGMVPGGVDIFVPSPDLARAREVLHPPE